MAVCQKCATESKPGASFCQACGAKLSEKPFLKPEHYTLILVAIAVVNFVILLTRLNTPFVGANEDENGLYGLAAYNLDRFGFFKLKFGMASAYYDSFKEIGTQFYTHHPQWFVMPTAVLYRLFGVSEAATRLPTILVSLLSLLAFYYTIYLYYGRQRPAVFSAFFYAFLPGLLYYGTILTFMPFVVAFSNFAILALFLHKKYEGRFFKFLLLAFVFLGGLVGWHFFFVPVAIWLYVLFDRSLPSRRFLLAAVPLVSGLTFFANFFHFYILKGGAFTEIFDAFRMRSETMPLDFFTGRYWFWLTANFTWLAPIVAAGFLIYCLYASAARRKFDLPLVYLVQPLLTLVFFQQWSAHAFGPIYWAPFIALSCGLVADKLLIKYPRYWLVPVAATLLFLYLVPGNLAVFTTKSLLMSPKDAQLLSAIRESIPPTEKIALGPDKSGLSFGPLVEWYLRRKVAQDWRERDVRHILAFNRGGEYSQVIDEMLEAGYKQGGGAELFLLLQRKPDL